MLNAYLTPEENIISQLNFYPDFSLFKKDDQRADQILESKAFIEGLVVRAQNGEREAFSLIYREYVEQLYRYVHIRIGRAEQAEDITQEVFIKALHSIRSYRYKGKSFASWLFSIARNQIIDYYRQTKKYKQIPIIETVNSNEYDDPVTSLEQNVEISMIKQAIEELPPRQKEVISLRFGAELSIAETAQSTGISEGSVKKLQHEAIIKLRKIMEKNEQPTRALERLSGASVSG
jgi:RNA polymerase sigma-70 factor (ECF subfamily)